MQIDGALALVTGGAGLLGSATVLRLAEQGATVLVADLAEGSNIDFGNTKNVHFVRADVTDERDVTRAVEAAAELGDLRVVVNAAGAGLVRRTLDREGTVHDLASFRGMVELNLIGTFSVMSQAAALMARLEPDANGERGVVVNTSSLAGLEGSAGQIAYGAAKAGVAGMTLIAARDLAPAGIRVMTIAPGGMVEQHNLDYDDPRVAALLGNVPHPHRFGLPEEYALLVTQIIENPYLNGSVIRLDGGARLGWKY